MSEHADDAVNAGLAEGESHVISPLEAAKCSIRMEYRRRLNLGHFPEWEELPKSERDKLNSWALKKVAELQNRVTQLEDAITEAGLALSGGRPESAVMRILGKVMNRPEILKRQGI